MTTETEAHIRPFAAFLQELNDGDTHSELSDELVRLVEAVKLCGKTGTITFTLKVAPAGRGQSMVMVTDKIVVKAPEPSRAESAWFVDDDGNPVRHNPAQMQMPLKEVARPPLVNAERETGEAAR
jgi:hypothetical protein